MSLRRVPLGDLGSLDVCYVLEEDAAHGEILRDIEEQLLEFTVALLLPVRVTLG